MDNNSSVAGSSIERGLAGVEWQDHSVTTEDSSSMGGDSEREFGDFGSKPGGPSRANAEDDSEGLPSQGSALHGSGKCRPCHYFPTKDGCVNGKACKFCHLHNKGEGRERPGKAKRAQAKKKAVQIMEKLDGMDDTEEKERIMEELKGESGYVKAVVKSKMRADGKSEDKRLLMSL